MKNLTNTLGIDLSSNNGDIDISAAKEAGNAKAVNVVLIGILAKNSEMSYEKWVETIKTTVPAKFLDVNLKAFDLGYNL